MNNFEQVSSDDQQMLVAGREGMGGGGRSPGLMSRVIVF